MNDVRIIPVKGFPGYTVSEDGEVFGKSGQALKPASHRGYLMVRLYRSGEQYDRYVHRIVADNYLQPNSKRKEINHIDHNKQNNAVGNIEWCTRIENIDFAHRKGLYDKKLSQLDRDSIALDSRPNGEIAKEYGIDPSWVSRLKNGDTRRKRKSANTLT